MILRTIALIGGLSGAAGLSQFPAYSNAYEQRLSGAVDELRVVVNDFDASARDAGLSRDAALSQMTGTSFLDNRQADMTRTFRRYDWLTTTLNRVRLTGPFGEFVQAPRFADTEIGRAALSDFKPALPITLNGFIFAAIGFVIGWTLIEMILRLLAWPFRRTRRT